MNAQEINTHIKELLRQSQSGWLDLCQALDKHLPELAGKGRMKKEDVEASFLGSLGYLSFAEYVDQELNWSMHTYRSYRRAWNIVKQHPYLKDLGVGYAVINKNDAQFKKDGIDWPIDKESYLEILGDRSKRVTSEADVQKLKAELKEAQLRLKEKTDALEIIKSAKPRRWRAVWLLITGQPTVEELI